MQKKTNYCILDSTCILPGAFKLWVLPVHYQHVWKIRAPLNNIQGRNIVKGLSTLFQLVFHNPF